MTGEILIDWAVLTISLFNTILLFWLGLTVLLNAEQRRLGVWLVGGGLLLGGFFFLSHSAILGLGFDFFRRGVNLWWQMGWVPVLVLPFAWYLIMLWYAGFWDDRESILHHRHRPWLLLTVLMTAGMTCFFLFANPLPTFTQVVQLDISRTPLVGGIPLITLIYPIYLILCIALSLDVLRHPGPTERAMGELARRRARPWLTAASILLLLVSFLVGWVMVVFILEARPQTIEHTTILTITWFDLTISFLISVAIILMGQAVISYEVFTGKSLPRRGLQRDWNRAVILAAGYSLIVGLSLSIGLHQIYSLLLATILIAVFYALLSWRSYVERERYIQHLRPFVASQRLYEQLLHSSESVEDELDVKTPFAGLCEDVLDTQLSYLVALGPLAPFIKSPLVYPPGLTPNLPPPAEIRARFESTQTLCIPLDTNRYENAAWAVPLWSERGLIGVLLLGMKKDNGLYSQEEMEIARTVGERLIDVLASTEIARRLIALQRQRMAESQVLDRRTRRVLHDEILPQLHTLILELSGGQSAINDDASNTIKELSEVHRQITDLLQEMPAAIAPEVERLGLLGAVRRVVDGELGTSFDDVIWEITPNIEREIDDISPLTSEVLYYATREAIRNAARHGRGDSTTYPLQLKIAILWRDGLEILIEDNGQGMKNEGEIEEGHGQGLALHSTLMALVGGSLLVESLPGQYTRVVLSLPYNAPN
jgi:signal transduction histidine kinase